MAITFEIDVSDIVSLPFQCDVSEDRTVHRVPSRSQIRVRPSPSTTVSCDTLKVAVAVSPTYCRPCAGAVRVMGTALLESRKSSSPGRAACGEREGQTV